MEQEKDQAQDLPQGVVDSDALEEKVASGNVVDAKSEDDQELDEQHLVLKKLLLAHEVWFNVTRDYDFGGRYFPGYAEFHSHGEKYVLVKKAKLWEVDAHEYLFFAMADTFTEDLARDWVDFMKNEAFKKVNPEPNHMTSYISLVVVANTVEEKAGKVFAKTRFHKELKMGLQGWVDMRLAALDVTDKKIFANGMGKELEPQLRSALGLPIKKKLFRR